jgi:hypothetical protein
MKKIIVFILGFSLLATVIGCDAFVRKFTKKPKTNSLPVEEMVLVPEEYKGPGMSKEELYRQYFLFWKSWQDELIESLLQMKGQKRKLSCIEEAIKNILNLRELLNEATQKKLDSDLSELRILQDSIKKDLYGNDAANNALNAERIKLNIMQKFSYKKIKDNLI